MVCSGLLALWLGTFVNAEAPGRYRAVNVGVADRHVKRKVTCCLSESRTRVRLNHVDFRTFSMSSMNIRMALFTPHR